jgi:hypothetical protein
VVFAVCAFLIVTVGALFDIGRARRRLRDGSAGLPPDWQSVFARTMFTPIAPLLLGEELSAAPLSLLRLLRIEVWRIYAKHLVCVEILAVAMSAGVALISPAWRSLPSPPASAGWLLAGALLLVACVAAAWLLLDEAIGRMSGAITSASGVLAPRGAVPGLTRQTVLPPQRVAVEPARDNGGLMGDLLGELLRAFERLSSALLAGSSRSETAGELTRNNAALMQVLERLEARLATPVAPVAAPPREPEPAQDPALLAAVAARTDALRELARSVERLASEAIPPGWGELEGTVRGIGDTLASLVEALHAQPAPTGPRTLTDELNALLDEFPERVPRAG